MIKRLAFLYALLLMWSSAAHTQTPASQWLVKKAQIKGVPENIRVTAFLQDAKGFLWMATVNGLYRYDGFHTRAWRNEATDSTSLSHNYISTLAQDASGNIWAGTYGAGLNFFDFRKGRLERLPQTQTAHPLQMVVKLHYSRAGQQLWVSTPGALVRYTHPPEAPAVYPIPYQAKDESGIKGISESGAYLYFITESSFFRFHKPSGQLKPIALKDAPEQRLLFRCLVSLGNSRWLAGHVSGVRFIDTTGASGTEDPALLQFFQQTEVNELAAAGEGACWIAGSRGLFHYQAGSGRLQVVDSTLNDITALFQDRSGTLWVSSRSRGLYQVLQPEVLFHTVQLPHKAAESIVMNQLTEAPDASWWVATDDGLYRYQRGQEPIRVQPPGLPPEAKSLLFYFEGPSGQRWISTRTQGMYYRKREGEAYAPVALWRSRGASTSPGFLISPFFPSSGMWGAHYSNYYHHEGFFKWNPDNNRFEHRAARFSQKNFLMPAALSEVAFTSDKEWWAGTWNAGLFRLRQEHDSLVIVDNLHIGREAGKRLSLNVVSCVRVDKKGRVWAGTVGGGLNGYWPDRDSSAQYTLENGLPSNLIFRIEEDRLGYLWISTDNGISRFEPETGRFVNYNKTNGLPQTHFSFISSLQTRDGWLVFGTNNGQLVYFDPARIAAQPNRRETVITEIRLGNEVLQAGNGLLTEAPYFTRELRLSYRQAAVISVSFTALNLQHPEPYAFSYKLEGFDKDWVQVSDRNSLTYTNLDPGSYELLIRNADHTGMWNEEPARLRIIIDPPFWQRSWFILLVLATTVALIYAFFQFRMKQRLRVLEVRNRLHRDLHDDVGATLSSVKAYSEILQENPDHPLLPALIKENASEMIERLEVIAWATNPQHDTFRSLEQQVRKFGVPLFHALGTGFRVEKTGIEEDMIIPGEVRQQLFLILKEAMNNCAKYAEASAVRVYFERKGHRFVALVEDNGKGIARREPEEGNGLRNMKKRAENLNGELRIESSGKGTTLEVVLRYPFPVPRPTTT